jgi:hypothetical protein
VALDFPKDWNSPEIRIDKAFEYILAKEQPKSSIHLVGILDWRGMILAHQ